jgi:hypothetical protein
VKNDGNIQVDVRHIFDRTSPDVSVPNLSVKPECLVDVAEVAECVAEY